jgi:CheY-like chemotaxis protein
MMENTCKSWTVLCVDDDKDSLILIGHMLKLRPNIKLLTSTEALQGLELAKTHLPDLIILDINLPQMDGYAMLRHLQDNENTRNISVMACSAHSSQTEIDKSLSAGFMRYLVKPFKIQVFLELIDSILADKQ